MTTIYYSLNDINEILFNSFEYKLNEATLTIISELSSKIGVPTNYEKPMQKTHSETDKPDRQYRSRNRKQNTVFTNDGSKEEAWEQLRSFKATVVEKKTDGIEKTLNDIRICLNKISQKNYDNIQELIIGYIDIIKQTEDSQESMKKVANHIFEIASTNKFFSDIYARLYKELVNRYDIFQDILSHFISTFTDKFKDIKYFDQNTDYDGFCANNKINDARKATSIFIVNLVKKEVLSKDILLSTIHSIINIILEYIDIPDKVNEVEEITENMFLLVSESHIYMNISPNESIDKSTEGLPNESNSWNLILEKIREISQMKVKEKKSLSSRALFKYMDIMDKTVNNKK
jgi:hypothetical protein